MNIKILGAIFVIVVPGGVSVLILLALVRRWRAKRRLQAL